MLFRSVGLGQPLLEGIVRALRRVEGDFIGVLDFLGHSIGLGLDRFDRGFGDGFRFLGEIGRASCRERV